ncbi:MAG: type II toxin-antitoxin system VapC family toxin [Verrucomicrobiota bacterium]|nr:type II toxin-antitoxin system VapC family toxin [Verrucomicrobiota bacterium]
MIFDTNALSDYADGSASLKEVIKFSKGFYLPVIVLGEYRYGVLDSREKEARLSWLKQVTGFFGVIDVSGQTSIFYAEIRLELKSAGTPIPENDIWIAALSRQFDMPLLTKDKHFGYVQRLRVISW